MSEQVSPMPSSILDEVKKRYLDPALTALGMDPNQYHLVWEYLTTPDTEAYDKCPGCGAGDDLYDSGHCHTACPGRGQGCKSCEWGCDLGIVDGGYCSALGEDG